MQYKFEFRAYQRKFKRPLQTSHGIWDIREGIILRLVDENGRIGWGEIAPLSWFGSETFEQALDFCQQLPANISSEMIFAISAELPACQFGFESAWENLSQVIENTLRQDKVPKNQCSGLLPAGETALQVLPRLWLEGFRTFKWKIGVAGIEEELTIFQQLIAAMDDLGQYAWDKKTRRLKPRLYKQNPPTRVEEQAVKITLSSSVRVGGHRLTRRGFNRRLILLRLDANGGLTYSEAEKWLEACDSLTATPDLAVEIEFLEQPLAIAQFPEMVRLNATYKTAIALDESAANLDRIQECYNQGWRGIFVIKPAICGSPSQLRKFCQTHNIDAVFSSVFETKIGRQAALNLATKLSLNNRALGFGTDRWFDDNQDTWLQHLWQKI
ncbi:o-succinylbenzoate synthase [Microcoleus sp. herbarium12]|uniref:o-succinylbenzoate synthase n=1 Tax=Microcoleus sp. herbarium12 TaxID=3055437 RepID=UPI002FD48524